MVAVSGLLLVQGLPAWNILLVARKPFAVALYDCSAVPAVLSSVNAKVRNHARILGTRASSRLMMQGTASRKRQDLPSSHIPRRASVLGYGVNLNCL